MIRKLLLVTALMVAFTGSSIFGADLLQLIPEEADFVFEINVGKLTNSPEVKKAFVDNMAKSPEQKKAFDEFVKNTGFNPMENLKKVVIFSSGKVVDKKAQNAGAIFEGDFTPSKIMEAIKKDEKASKDVEFSKIEGFDAMIPKSKKDGFGVFLDNNTAVVGAEKGIMSVIAVKKGKAKNISNKKSFFAVLSKVDHNATLSGAGNIPAELKAKVKANPQAAPLAALNFFHFSFNHGDTIEFNFNGEVDKKENVETVMTSLNGFLAMLKMFAGQAPEAAEVLNMVKLTSAETSVKISLNVPKAKLEEIKKKMEDRIKQMQKAPEANKDADERE